MRENIQSAILLIILSSAIWWMSANVVWLGDDLDYKYMMRGEIWQSWGRIKTIKAFFDSQWIHYQHVNGRYVAHSIVQAFNAHFGQQAFAVCNAIVYGLFALLIAKAGGMRLKGNPEGILSAVCIAVLCFITKMMPTCQIGYIWGLTANIAWMMEFFRNDRPSWPTAIAMLIAGTIVGNWQESISIGVCGGLGFWWIVQLSDSVRLRNARFDWRRSWMLFGYVAGTASNCFAPSTMGRVSDITMPLTDQILIASYSFPAVALLAICVVYVGLRHRRPNLFSFENRMGLIPEGVLLFGTLLLIVFNVAIGIYSNRQLFGANLFAAILTLRILPRHRLGTIANTLAAVAVLAFWMLMLKGIYEVKRQYDEITVIHSQSADGTVYYDRTRVMTLGFPLRAKYYEDILGLFDNDLHHSLMKDFKHVRKGKTLKLKPTVTISGERVDYYSPGHFTVTMKEPPKGEAPREIIVYGHYPVFGLKAKPRKLQVTRYSNRSKTHATAVIIPEFPFFTADSIRIIEEEEPIRLKFKVWDAGQTILWPRHSSNRGAQCSKTQTLRSMRREDSSRSSGVQETPSCRTASSMPKNRET